MRYRLYSLFFLLFSLCIFTGIKVFATDNNGKILVNKTCVKDDFTYDRNALVNLEINGVEYSKYKSLEIVFVIDRSSNMDNKIETIKSSTKKVINDLLKNGNVKVGIVTFGYDVLDDYTTSELTNNNDSLVNLIDSIPNNSYSINYFGLGTNISSGIEYANSLFSNSNGVKKSIILLSDGNVTNFTYENTIYGNGENDTSYCVKWDKVVCELEYSPSEYTKKVSNEIKKDNISIYSVGIGVNNNDKELLTTISDKYYYSKNSEDDLIDSFNNAIDNITVIGKDIVITDTISKYFTINKEEILKDYPGTTIIDNTDDSTTLKFYLDSIDTLNTYNFKYKIYTKNNYYGYIYTSNMTTIEGTSLIEGVYENNKIYEVFERPIVEISSISNSDNYSVKLGTSLITDNVSGILNNDYLDLINNKNVKIKDKIVIEDTDNSCGNLKVNEDGSFIYIPDVDCLGKQVEFNYYIETNIDNKIVKSNTSRININVYKDDVSIVNPKVNNKGTIDIEDINSLVEYKINYSSIVENYLGNAKVIIVDKLPCEIDKDNSLLEGAIYDKDNLTLTWIIDINDINTYKDGKKLIDITKNIKLKYINITDYRNLTNSVEVKLETSEKNNIVKDSFDTSINIKGNVIVSYIDNDGNKLLDDVIINDLVNNDYITKEEKIEDYVLVNTVGQVSGKISLEEKHVKYIYYHNSANYEENLIKTGTLKIDNYDNRIDYNIKYDTLIDNYTGEVEVMVIDYLPHKIDLDNSILNNFIYHEEDNILVYNFKNNIDTYKNGSYSIDIDENLTLKYIDIDNDARTITNRVESLIITDTNTLSEDVFVTNIEIKSNVIGEYIDEEGNKIANDIVISNLVGNDYVLDKLDVKGYTLKEIKGDDIGKHTKDDKVVTFVYEKNKIISLKTSDNNINYSSILLVVTACFNSFIFRKKMI